MLRWYISACFLLLIAEQNAVAWDERTSSRSNKPISEGSESGDTTNSNTDSTGPVFATFRTQPSQPVPEQITVLGNRDDSLESSYVLEGRGKEVGAGRKQGRYCEPGMERAGLPYCLRLVAQPSTDCYHSLGYVGGGTPFHFWGERRYIHEGTVGLDYSGRYFHRKTWLLWSHGGLYQGGSGRYQTDGPRILPEKE